MAKDKAVKAVNNTAGPWGYVLFMAWVGAVIYFVGQVDGFWNIIVAFLKACVWPAYVMYDVLQSLGI